MNHRQIAYQTVLLVHCTHQTLKSPQLLGAEAVCVLPHQQHATGGGYLTAVEQTEQRALPAPLEPMSATRSPGAIASVQLLRAST
ncbi:MAG: hypothetical protein WBB18_05845, partial [Nodosilinea sp.]